MKKSTYFIGISLLILGVCGCRLDDIHEIAESEPLITFSKAVPYKTQYSAMNDMILSQDESIMVVGYAAEESYVNEGMVLRIDSDAIPINAEFPKKYFGPPFYFDEEVVNAVVQHTSGAYFVCGQIEDADLVNAKFGHRDKCGFYGKIDNRGVRTIFHQDTVINDLRTSFSSFVDLAVTQDGYLTIIGWYHTGNSDDKLQIIKVDTQTGSVINGFPQLYEPLKSEGRGYPLGFIEAKDGSLYIYGGAGSDLATGFIWKFTKDGKPVGNGFLLTPDRENWNWQRPSTIVELDNGNLMLIGNHGSTNFGESGNVFLYIFDKELNQLNDKPMLIGSDVTGKYYTATHAVKASNGNIYISGYSNDQGANSDGASLIIVNQEGTQLDNISPRVYDIDANLSESASKIVELSDGGFLLGGRQGSDLLFIKVDRNGKL